MKPSRLFAASVITLSLALGAMPALAQMPPPSQTPAPLPTDVSQWVTPALRHWVAAEGTFSLTAQSRIVSPAKSKAIAERFADDLVSLGGPRLKVVTGKARAGDVVFSEGAVAGQSSHEAYTIAISDRIQLTSTSEAGLFYSTQSLLQLLKYDSARQTLPRGTATDWPDYAYRSMMVDIGRKYYEIDQLENLMREMAWLKLNTLRLHFNDWPAFRLKSDKFPGLAADQAYSREDVERIEATARRYHILVIPEIDVPAHAVALTEYRPSLGFKCESMRRSEWLDRAAQENAPGKAWTIDITKEENRAWIRDLLNEFIPWFSGPYFHIGGDEYQYDKDKTQCPELMQAVKDRGFQYPGDIFVDWINETNKVVQAHGKTTMIWNWWRFKDDKTSIQPSTDIVIETWNVPRQESIIADGYKVLISPEERLYVVPGIENFNGEGYGLVDNKGIYENFPMAKGPNVMGYSVALWADASETFTDQYMLAKAYEPMAIMAERNWSGSASVDLRHFLARLNKTSAAPR